MKPQDGRVRVGLERDVEIGGEGGLVLDTPANARIANHSLLQGHQDLRLVQFPLRGQFAQFGVRCR